MDKEENTAVEMHVLLPSGSNMEKNDFEELKEWGWEAETESEVCGKVWDLRNHFENLCWEKIQVINWNNVWGAAYNGTSNKNVTVVVYSIWMQRRVISVSLDVDD